MCTLAEEGLGGSENSLASLLLPLQGLDVGVEPEVVVVAGRRVQVRSVWQGAAAQLHSHQSDLGRNI